MRVVSAAQEASCILQSGIIGNNGGVPPDRIRFEGRGEGAMLSPFFIT